MSSVTDSRGRGSIGYRVEEKRREHRRAEDEMSEVLRTSMIVRLDGLAFEAMFPSAPTAATRSGWGLSTTTGRRLSGAAKR